MPPITRVFKYTQKERKNKNAQMSNTIMTKDNTEIEIFTK